MNEEQHRTWDIRLKIFATFGTIASLLWGVYQYTDTQDQAIEAERIARDRAFAEDLFKLTVDEYQSIAAAAGKLSEPSKEPAELLQDIINFERLYWSSLATLKSDQVVKAMDYLRIGIENYQRGMTMLGDSTPEDQLKIRARSLSRTIRSAIEQERSNLAVITTLDSLVSEKSK